MWWMNEVSIESTVKAFHFHADAFKLFGWNFCFGQLCIVAGCHPNKLRYFVFANRRITLHDICGGAHKRLLEKC